MDPKSVKFFVFYSFGNRYRRDRNGLQMVQNAPKPHFWVILTHRCMSWVCSPCSFRAFWSHTTAKSVQNVTQFRPKRLSKVLFAARKCRQSAFLVSFANLSPIIFFDCRDGWVDFQRGFRLVPASGALLYHGKRQLMVKYTV